MPQCLMQRPLAALLVLLLTACATVNQETRIDTLLQGYEGRDVPGASVLVLHKGLVVFQKAYGMANLEQQISASLSTHYRLASVSKQFTAAAVLNLAGRGKLSLNDSIRNYLPSLPAWANAITIRQLLTHTSGITDYEDLIPENTGVQLRDIDVLRLLEAQTSTYFAPGSAWRYSNSGYALLGLIIAKVARQSFARFLEQSIFEPLEMQGTVAYEEGISRVANRAFGYTRAGTTSRGTTRWMRDDQSLTSAVLGDGGIYSSVEELTHWLRALDEGLSLEATVGRIDTDKPGVRYGYGWRVSDHKGRRTVWHTGETRGFRNALVRFPDERLSVVILTNRNEGDPIDLALAIADVYLEPATPRASAGTE